MSSLNILDDAEHFKRCFNVFLKKMLERGTFITQWLQDNVLDDVQAKILSSVVANSTKGTLRALGVGSGAGQTEDFFVSYFKPRFEKVYQRIVEPNKPLLQQHRDTVAKTGLPGVTYDWRELSIKGYMENVKEAGKQEKFHFISSIHSVYHFSDPIKSLEYLYDQLNEDGILLIAVGAESSITQLLANSGIIPVEYSRHYCSNSHVREYFDSRGIPYDLYTRQQKLDVSGCLDDNDDVQEEDSLLLDFLTHVKDFRKAQLPQNIKDKVFSTIRDRLISAPLENNEADLTMLTEHVIIVQRKSIL